MTTSAGLFAQEGYDSMAAVFAVHTELGSGFLEEVYHEALEVELTRRGIAHESNQRLSLTYKDVALQKYYVTDMIVGGQIVVELKAVKALTAEHDAQLINYLKATRKHVGYLINFGSFPRLQWKRLVL
jgi:GxxExxY protein